MFQIGDIFNIITQKMSRNVWQWLVIESCNFIPDIRVIYGYIIIIVY